MIIKKENTKKIAIVFKIDALEEIQKLKHLIDDDKKLHKIRIHLKAALEILLLICRLSNDQGLNEFRKELKSLATIIGKWHDYISLTFVIRRSKYQLKIFT